LQPVWTKPAFQPLGAEIGHPFRLNGCWIAC